MYFGSCNTLFFATLLLGRNSHLNLRSKTASSKLASAQRDFETRKVDIVYRSKALFDLRATVSDALSYIRSDSAWGQWVQAIRS